MRSSLLFGTLMIGLLSFTVDDGWGQGKGKNDGDVHQATPQDYAILAQHREIVAQVREWNVRGRLAIIRLEYNHVEVAPPKNPPGPGNGGKKNNKKADNGAAAVPALAWMPATPSELDLGELHFVGKNDNKKDNKKDDKKDDKKRRQAAEIARQRQRALNELYRAQADALRRSQNQLIAAMRAAQDKANRTYVDRDFKDFELPFEESVVLRKLSLGIEYDDKGFLKETSEEMLEKLRGSNPKLPGFIAKADDFDPGSIVKLYLSPPKKGEGLRPSIRMAVLLQDSPKGGGGKK